MVRYLCVSDKCEAVVHERGGGRGGVLKEIAPAISPKEYLPMADGPLDRYEWDPNYFSTYDKVYEDLCIEYGRPTVSKDTFGPTMLTFKENDKIFLVYHAFFAGSHRVKYIMEGKHVTYPISLPRDVEFKTLRPGDFLYRMLSDDEGRQENGTKRTKGPFESAATPP